MRHVRGRGLSSGEGGWRCVGIRKCARKQGPPSSDGGVLAQSLILPVFILIFSVMAMNGLDDTVHVRWP